MAEPIPESVFEAFGSDGYAVTPSVFDDSEIGTIREECEEMVAGSSRWAVLAAAAHRPRLLAFAKHAVFERICALTIGSEVDLLFDGILYKPPQGGKELRWHQDAAYGRTDTAFISCWMPLSTGDPDSGGLRVAPGSHRRGAVEHTKALEEAGTYAGPVATTVPRESEPLHVSPGQVVVLHSDVLHCSGPNHTATGRLAYQCGFASASTRFLDAGLAGDHRLPLFRAGDQAFASSRKT